MTLSIGEEAESIKAGTVGAESMRVRSVGVEVVDVTSSMTSSKSVWTPHCSCRESRFWTGGEGRGGLGGLRTGRAAEDCGPWECVSVCVAMLEVERRAEADNGDEVGGDIGDEDIGG